jgi:uncharacterized protein (TIGR00369 family)
VEGTVSSDLDEVKALIDSQPKPVCAQLTPFEIVDADCAGGFVRLKFEEQPAFRNHFGNVQGGFAVAMLDAPISIAAYVKARAWLPTIEIKSSFLEALPIGPCIGEGRVLKLGKSLAFIEGRLLRTDGRPAVIATATALVPLAK